MPNCVPFSSDKRTLSQQLNSENKNALIQFQLWCVQCLEYVCLNIIILKLALRLFYLQV